MRRNRGLTTLETGFLVAGGVSLLIASGLVAYKLRKGPPPPAVVAPVDLSAQNARFAAHRNAGLAALSRSDYDVAVQQFTEALKHGPANPDIIELLRVAQEFKAGTREAETEVEAPAKQEAPPSKPVATRVDITIEPADATVMLDGSPVNSPLRLNGPDGQKHRLVASAPGYDALAREFVVDRDFSVTWTLRPTPRRAPPPVVRKAPPPAPAKAVVVAKPEEPTPEVEKPAVTDFAELPARPKVAPKGTRLDTNVFDDKKQEIDRADPFDSN